MKYACKEKKFWICRICLLFQVFATYSTDLCDAIITKLRPKKLKFISLEGIHDEDYELEKFENIGGALIANHADTLEILKLVDLDIATTFHGNRPLPKLKTLYLDNCVGSLDSILGICRKLETLQMKDSEMKINTTNFSLSSLQYLILWVDWMSDEDVAKLKSKLPRPSDMIRNDLRDDNQE